MDLTDYGMLLGVAIRQDHVFVALFDGGSGAIPNGVYRLRNGGKLSQVVSLDEGVWPNGIAFHGLPSTSPTAPTEPSGGPGSGAA